MGQGAPISDQISRKGLVEVAAFGGGGICVNEHTSLQKGKEGIPGERVSECEGPSVQWTRVGV